jgi:hypothetical protein
MKNKNFFLEKQVDKRNILKVMKQQGTVGSIPRDYSRKARLPGQRVSRSGKIYWETRVNRSDAPNKKI